MSDISQLKEAVESLTTIVNKHIAETNEYRKHRDKIVDAHSEALWDKEGRIGLLTKVDRLIQTEAVRVKVYFVMITATVGIAAERLWEGLKQLKP